MLVGHVNLSAVRDHFHPMHFMAEILDGTLFGDEFLFSDVLTVARVDQLIEAMSILGLQRRPSFLKTRS